MQVEILSTPDHAVIPPTSLDVNVLYVVQVAKDAPKVLRLRGYDNTMYGLGHGARGIQPNDTWDIWRRADSTPHGGFYSAKKVVKMTVETEE